MAAETRDEFRESIWPPTEKSLVIAGYADHVVDDKEGELMTRRPTRIYGAAFALSLSVLVVSYESREYLQWV